MKTKLDFIKALVKKSKKSLKESENEDMDVDAAISKVNDAKLLVKKAKELVEALEEENEKRI